MCVLRRWVGMVLLLLPVAQILEAQEAPRAGGAEVPASQQAVRAVVGMFTIDTLAKVGATGAPLSVHGDWSVGKDRPTVCPADNTPCVRVFYRVPQDGVRCEWVVTLTEPERPDSVLFENADAQRYLLRTIADGDRAALVASRKLPAYPAIAQAAHVQGEVVLRARIDEGRMSSVGVVSGPAMLRAAAVDPARQWTFLPVVVAGQPVRYEMKLSFTFRTNGPGSPSPITASP